MPDIYNNFQYLPNVNTYIFQYLPNVNKNGNPSPVLPHPIPLCSYFTPTGTLDSTPSQDFIRGWLCEVSIPYFPFNLFYCNLTPCALSFYNLYACSDAYIVQPGFVSRGGGLQNHLWSWQWFSHGLITCEYKRKTHNSHKTEFLICTPHKFYQGSSIIGQKRELHVH